MMRACCVSRFVSGTLLVAGCARSTSGNPPTAPLHPGAVITQERIAASGAKTAWDAIRLAVPNVQLRESRGKAARIQRRGRASIYLDDQVRVIVDKRAALRPPAAPADAGGRHPHHRSVHGARRGDVLRRDVDEWCDRDPDQDRRVVTS